VSDKIWFDPDVLWEESAKFFGWKYRLNPEGFPPGPTYPAELIRNAKEKKVGMDFSGADNIYLHNQTHNTNCCMFTEAVIISAAMRGNSLNWTIPLHNDAVNIHNNAKAPKCPPIMAYVTAGMAELADIKDKPAHGDWCICQTDGHSFFIIDYDKNTEFCLTLEANTFVDGRRSVRTGFVGHRGRFVKGQKPWGTELQLQRPDDKWAEVMAGVPGNADLIKWSVLEKEIVRFARLNLLTSVISLPIEGSSSPARNYFLNEQLQSGFFPLGTYHNIHTGIHLLPPKAAAPAAAPTGHKATTPAAAPTGHKVHAMAPGTIVALRLPNYVHAFTEPVPVDLKAPPDSNTL
jgi:hypothetical protein